MPRVVWAEESQTGLGFEIGVRYDAGGRRAFGQPVYSSAGKGGVSRCERPLIGRVSCLSAGSNVKFGMFEVS